MTPKRPKELKWTGKTYGDGRPVEFINDLEPRDYNEEETDALTQDQLASARHSSLYREVHAPEKKSSASKTSAKAKIDNDPANHADPGDPNETATATEAPTEPAAESASEGNGE